MVKASLTKQRAKQKLMSEIKIHRALSHAGVVKLLRYFEDRKNVYILLELCHNGSMNDMLKRRKRFTDVEVRYFGTQIIQALKYMREEHVIHRDLKLGNLFIDQDMRLKLGDFGLATKVTYDGEKKRTICGTPNYIAPEVLSSRIGHSYEVDVWSLGVIFYTLLFGRPPFETSDVKQTYKRIKSNSYQFPENVKVPHSAKDMIQRILKTDPAK